MRKIRHYGWQVSPYSAKTRSYLRYAGIDFNDVSPTLFTLLCKIKPAVGVAIMPTLQLTDGTFIKDSSNIIDYFEILGDSLSVNPITAKQHVANAVLEVYADEWLPLVSLHYRWNRPSNAEFAILEFGKEAAPWLPAPLKRMIGLKIASKMQRYLPHLGVTRKTQPGIERTTTLLLDDMDEVLTCHPYLFGERPSLADFSLYGPLYAHLYRDPDTTSLFDHRHSLRAWIERMNAPKAYGEFLEGDVIPSGVERILKRAFAEQWRYLRELVRLIDDFADNHPGAGSVPRALGHLPIEIGGVVEHRKAVTSAQWKMQRACQAYANANASEKPALDKWLLSLGGQAVMQGPAHVMAYDDMSLRLT